MSQVTSPSPFPVPCLPFPVAVPIPVYYSTSSTPRCHCIVFHYQVAGMLDTTDAADGRKGGELTASEELELKALSPQERNARVQELRKLRVFLTLACVGLAFDPLSGRAQPYNSPRAFFFAPAYGMLIGACVLATPDGVLPVHSFRRSSRSTPPSPSGSRRSRARSTTASRIRS